MKKNLSWHATAARVSFVFTLSACSGEHTYEAGTFGTIDSPQICGDEDPDWQHVESYVPTLGVPASFVNRHQGPVNHWGCTGTLIAPNIYITAGHCVTGATNSRRFNHQLDPVGNPRTEDVYSVAELLEDELGGLDYAILRVTGNPGAVWGTTVPSVFSPAAGETIAMIHHPGGDYKRVGVSSIWYSSSGQARYDLDTVGGSSGAGLLQASTGYMVAVHSGARSGSPCSNGGDTIAEIWEHSPIIRRLAMDAAKVVTAIQ